MYPAHRREQAAHAYAQGAAAIPPAAMLVQLHDGMVAKLVQARTAIHEGRIEDRLDASLKVAAVIEALHLALDTEQGGEVAANLGRLYGYFIGRLQALNVANDAAICDELIARLGDLRQGWAATLDAGRAATLDGPILS